MAGSVNTAADFLSRLGLKVTEKIHLTIQKDVQTTPIEVSTSSSNVADEEQFFFTQTDSQEETEELILQRKERSQKKAAEWVVNQEPPSMKPSIKEITNIDGNTMSYSINGSKASARKRVEQDSDLVLKNPKLKILGQPHDDVLLATDDLNTTKQMRIALSSKMDSYSGNTTEKQLASNTTKFSYRSSLLTMYSGISTETLVNILELTRR